MDKQVIQQAYAGQLLLERDQETLKQALKKVSVITRSMRPAEKEAYLQSSAFQATLQQIRRKDRIYQALLRGELPQPWQQAELDRLLPLMSSELHHGHPISLPFLRSVERSRASLTEARKALKLLETRRPRQYFREERTRLLKTLEQRTVSYLRKGNLLLQLPGESQPEQVVQTVIQRLFRNGLSLNAVNQALHPDTLTHFLRQALEKAFPELRACSRVCLPSGETVSAAVNREVQEAAGQLFHGLRERFPANRIRALLKGNPALVRRQKQADAALARQKQLQSALLQAIPEHYRDLYPLARSMRRRWILHLGPTNSGKTYEGVARLHGASHGIYLGPLRLLAAEQFEALNLDDVPCSLVTGEEQILVPGSRVQSSTVEMADLKAHYDVAVIDECQMIADRDRGGAWSAALLGLCAEEIHACASPDAEGLLTRIIQDCGDDLTIVRHERMTPLEMDKDGFQFPTSVRPGDALIVLSKARVHAVAAELRSRGVRVSLIYGALPPDVRRNQAERFHRGETDVVVSTDAIAMGMNLPIERVVFLESEKYDGDITRTLTDAEIKQIAGRAGRYGQYEVGYVNAFGFRGLIAQALEKPLLPLTEAVIRFPESLLGLPLPLSQIINQWLAMQDKGLFSKASTVRMASLTAMMETRHTDKALLYRFLCIPFDETDPDLLARWKAMYQAENRKEHLDVLPELPEIRNPEECTIQQLDLLEAEYRRCDLYYNYVRLFLEEPTRLMEEIQRRKDLISRGIVHILSTQKLQPKICRSCHRRLPWNWPYSLCDSCYRRRR